MSTVIAPDDAGAVGATQISGPSSWNGTFLNWIVDNTSGWGPGGGNYSGSGSPGVSDHGWLIDTTTGTSLTVTVPVDARCGDGYTASVSDSAGNLYQGTFSVGPNLAPSISDLRYYPAGPYGELDLYGSEGPGFVFENRVIGIEADKILPTAFDGEFGLTTNARGVTFEVTVTSMAEDETYESPPSNTATIYIGHNAVLDAVASDTGITLVWKAAQPQYVGTFLIFTGYSVYRSVDGADFIEIFYDNVLSYLDTDVTVGHEYVYYVQCGYVHSFTPPPWTSHIPDVSSKSNEVTAQLTPIVIGPFPVPCTLEAPSQGNPDASGMMVCVGVCVNGNCSCTPECFPLPVPTA